MATRVIVGEKVDPVDVLRGIKGRIGVKVPQFSFSRLTGKRIKLLPNYTEKKCILFCK